MPWDQLCTFSLWDNTCRTGLTLPEFKSDGLFVTGHQWYSLMRLDSVLILAIGVSWCGESSKRDFINQMWQNMTVVARAQSWFGQALTSTIKLTCMLLKTNYWWHWGIVMRFQIILWGHMQVLSVKNLFWWTIMPAPTVHTSLTPIWNMRKYSYGLACFITGPESDWECMGHSSAWDVSQTCATQDFTGAKVCLGCWMEADSTKPDTDSDYEHMQETSCCNWCLWTSYLLLGKF